MKTPPHTDSVLLHYPWVIVRFRCHVCERMRDARLAACVAHFGTKVTLRTLLHEFMAQCPHDPHSPFRAKPQKYGHRCGAYLPDIYRNGPPDLPPSMTGLSLIDGGKGDMLPDEPVAPERRRRVGGSDDV